MTMDGTAKTENDRKEADRWELGCNATAVIVTVFMVIIFLQFIYSSLQRSWQAKNESSAIMSIRRIASVQEQYRIDKTNGHRYCDSLPHLAELGYIDSELGSGRKDGYWFTLKAETMKGGRIDRWKANANPVQYGRTGKRHLFVNETGVLRQNATGPADESDDSCIRESLIRRRHSTVRDVW